MLASGIGVTSNFNIIKIAKNDNVYIIGYGIEKEIIKKYRYLFAHGSLWAFLLSSSFALV